MAFPQTEWKNLYKLTQAVLVFKMYFIQNGSEWKYKSSYFSTKNITDHFTKAHHEDLLTILQICMHEECKVSQRVV